MLNKIKVGPKLIGGFLLVALIAVAIGLYGIVNMGSLEKGGATMYKNATIPLIELGCIMKDIQERESLTYYDMLITDEKENQRVKKRINELQTRIEDNIASLQKSINSKDGQDALNKFVSANKEYIPIYNQVIALAMENKNNEAFQLAITDGAPLRIRMTNVLDSLANVNIEIAKQVAEKNLKTANSAVMMMIILLTIGVLFAMLIGIFLTNSISKPLGMGVNMMLEMAKGHLGIRLKMNRKDEVGILAQAMDDFSEDLQKILVSTVKKIGEGDLSTDLKPKDNQDEITPAIINTTTALRGLISEAEMLRKAAVDGKLATRGNANNFKGGYKDIVQGVNYCLDAVIGPLNVAAKYVDDISKGEIPEKINDNYNGDFNTIKNNLNKCIDAVNKLVADAAMLSKAAVNGKLATRADATKHEGDFRKIVQGVNDTLDAVIRPLNVAADYVDNISKGNTPAKITDIYNGDFNTIKNNLNNCIDAIENQADAARRIGIGDFSVKINVRSENDLLSKGLVNVITVLTGLQKELQRLTEASKNGLLSERGKPEQFQGAYAEVVRGVNTMLDAILLPIGEGNRVLAQISNGKIDELIAQTYSGDHEKMKQAVNNVAMVLQGLQKELQRLTEASKDGLLSERGKPEQFQGAYAEVVRGVNTMLDAILLPIGEGNRVLGLIRGGNLRERVDIDCKGDHKEMKDAINGVHTWLSELIAYVTKIAKGDLKNAVMDKASSDDQIHEWLMLMKSNINALVTDANMLSVAAVEGRLATRADAAKHEGDFRKIVQGVNETLDAVIGPLNVAADYVNNISNGNIPAKITDNYNGDFNTIKNNLNKCIDAVNNLVADATMLSKAAVEGKLATRADATKHEGDFRKIVQGVNETLDAVIGPLNVAADYVNNISNGNIPAKITDNYNGDFNTIKNNLNKCIDAVNNLVADATMLSKAAVEGKLATRADATKHEGDFRKIVQGVNETLDAVIGPLNVAADYVNNISNGNIPAKITDNYNGDFNTIKNNLNKCIDAVNKLVADATMLSKAAVEGKLATRADATKHEGDFRMIVQGVNETLDAVIGPLNVAADYVNNISNGNIPAKITDNYNGDFNAIKNNLNKCIDAVNKLVEDAVMLSNAAVEGRLATRADAAKHEGDFRKIVQGVNETLDAVITPVNEAASVLNNIANRDLTARMAGNYNGDLANIKTSLNLAVDNLDKALQQVTEATEQVTSASQQISSGSQNLAQGANEQASSLEEVSSSLEEMSSMTKQNAENANQAKGLSGEADQNAATGAEAMNRMSSAINRIKESSDQTAKIVKTIDEIAMQTNLLALNAAVEAARAGEAGRGFAVVAEEVRNLAQRSAQAAKNTADMISESVKNADDGVKIATEVTSAFSSIANSAKKVNDLIAEIAAASQEQAQGIDQVNNAVAQMDKVTQQNAANSEESASAAEELSSQAEELKTMIDQFALSHGQNHQKSFSSVQVDSKKTGTALVNHLHSADSKNNKKTSKKVSKKDDFLALDEEALKEF